MANDELKMQLTLEAKTNDNQIRKEVQDSADLAQKILDKQDLKFDLMIDQVKLEQQLEKAKANIKKLKSE